MGVPGSSSRPPVSTRVNSRPFQSPVAYTRSRVVPGTSSTIAIRSPANRLKSVDLPTLGRPTMATTGRVDMGRSVPILAACYGQADADRLGQHPTCRRGWSLLRGRQVGADAEPARPRDPTVRRGAVSGTHGSAPHPPDALQASARTGRLGGCV